jgi:hypothetical protein
LLSLSERHYDEKEAMESAIKTDANISNTLGRVAENTSGLENRD